MTSPQSSDVREGVEREERVGGWKGGEVTALGRAGGRWDEGRDVGGKEHEDAEDRQSKRRAFEVYAAAVKACRGARGIL